MSLTNAGVLSEKELAGSPGYKIELAQKKDTGLAVIECVERIPCNPCETVCPRGAIEVGCPITNLPEVDAEKCNGCGLCVAICPGLAIFIVDYSFAKDRGTVTFSYEFLPVPKVGDKVTATDRAGEKVCEGVVERVLDIKKNDMTKVVTISVPKAFLPDVRGMRV